MHCRGWHRFCSNDAISQRLLASHHVGTNQLTAYLEQDTTYYMFLRAGVYSKWSAKQLGLRVTKLSSTDPDKVKLDRELTNKDKKKDEYDTEIEKLKLLRNSQLHQLQLDYPVPGETLQHREPWSSLLGH